MELKDFEYSAIKNRAVTPIGLNLIMYQYKF